MLPDTASFLTAYPLLANEPYIAGVVIVVHSTRSLMLFGKNGDSVQCAVHGVSDSNLLANAGFGAWTSSRLSSAAVDFCSVIRHESFTRHPSPSPWGA